jgi:hypothetical protein
MQKGSATEIVARRLRIPIGRATALVQSASDAGIISKARGRSVPNMSTLELIYIALAIIADRGQGVAAQSVREFAALQTPDGLMLGDFLESVISARVNPANIKSAIFRLSPATVAIASGSHHLIFGGAGADDAAARTVLVPGSALAGMCLEFQGNSPEQADNAIAVSRLAAALH